jgi:hypothetical protein
VSGNEYARNVFVNCPFDEDYAPLLRPLLFTVVYAGLRPRIALEQMDSGQLRLEKLLTLIRESKLAIHDLSRLQATAPGEYSRLNMPFELGMDFGCRAFGAPHLGDKKLLILERERYRYQAALSDISGFDIRAHNDDPQEIVAAARDWLNCEAGTDLPGPSFVWDRFIDFLAEDYARLKALGYRHRDIQRVPVPELLKSMRAWADEPRKA